MCGMCGSAEVLSHQSLSSATMCGGQCGSAEAGLPVASAVIHSRPACESIQLPRTPQPPLQCAAAAELVRFELPADKGARKDPRRGGRAHGNPRGRVRRGHPNRAPASSGTAGPRTQAQARSVSRRCRLTPAPARQTDSPGRASILGGHAPKTGAKICPPHPPSGAGSGLHPVSPRHCPTGWKTG